MSEAINLLVAEKVMEWPTIDEHTPLRIPKEQGHAGYICNGTPYLYPPFGIVGATTWFPSGDIAAAWLVVEKMRADDWLVAIKCNTDAARFILEGSRSEYDNPCPDKPIGPAGAYACTLQCMRSCRDKDAKWRPDEWAIADTAPLAICKAALLALNEEIPE